MSKDQTNVALVLQQTAPTAIAELPFVKEKFINNYNHCHKDKVGEMQYHRQLMHFKQTIAGSTALQTAEPFSLYACFLTAAVKGYSLDPADNEVYLIPRGGKAYLQRQAGAHVRRLTSSGQVKFVEQAKFVYEGDDFEVSGGKVIKHIEKFSSERIVAGYVRFTVDEAGNDKFFIYRKSDWEAWRKKSPQANGENWTGGVAIGNEKQPVAAFLRTKLVLHAAMDKSWATGSVPATVEQFNVEVEEEEETKDVTATVVTTDPPPAPPTPQNQQQAAAHIAMTATEEKTEEPVVFTDESF